MAATKYFDPTEFIEKVLKESKLENLSPEERMDLELAIEKRLKERMTATIIDSFEERDFMMLSQMAQDHPELDGIEAISLIALNMPDLQEKLRKAVEELYEELIYDANRIDQMLHTSMSTNNSTTHRE